ncbi:MAG: PAS domain S-box protein [Caulobacter sp.]|nr:PAS domain S-box protein [Caulobacter sp.]
MRATDAEPVFVTAGEVARAFGRWQDEAARGPVVVTHHGRAKTVLLSAESFEAREADAGPTPDRLEGAYRSVLSNMAEGFVCLDQRMHFVEVNHVFEGFTGLSASQVIGRPWDEVFPIAARSIASEQFRRVLRTGEPALFEMASSVRPDAVLDVRAFPMPAGLGALFLNRTEERHLFQRLRGAGALAAALNEAGTAGILEINIRGAIVEASDSFVDLTGFQRSEILSCRLVDLLVPRTRPAVADAIEHVLTTAAAAAVDTIVLGRDGVETPVRLGLGMINIRLGAAGAKAVLLRR